MTLSPPPAPRPPEQRAAQLVVVAAVIAAILVAAMGLFLLQPPVRWILVGVAVVDLVVMLSMFGPKAFGRGGAPRR